MCFLCLWDSRADEEHYIKKIWLVRPAKNVGYFNCVFEPLVDANKVYLPPLHLKIGLFQQFVKAMDHSGAGFQYILKKYRNIISEAKIKGGVFNGPQIRTLIQDEDFSENLSELEKAAWESFVSITKNFLGKNRADNYRQLASNMIESYKALGARMSLKLHFFSHLDFFPTKSV